MKKITEIRTPSGHVMSMEKADNYDDLPEGLQIWERLKIAQPDVALQIYLDIVADRILNDALFDDEFERIDRRTIAEMRTIDGRWVPIVLLSYLGNESWSGIDISGTKCTVPTSRLRTPPMLNAWQQRLVESVQVWERMGIAQPDAFWHIYVGFPEDSEAV